MNSVMMIGHLDGDPVTRMVGGAPVVRLRLRVDDRPGEHDTLVDVDVHGRQGTAVEKYLSDGRRVAVVGRLASSVWRDHVSNRRHHVYVTAFSVEFLDRPPARPASSD